jgi:hypothetical protein
MERDPGKSFPRMFASDAELEAFYRFINSPGFEACDIVAPHVDATMVRARGVGVVLAVHDTTNVEFGAARHDLGPTTGKNHWGFLAHTVLLLAANDGLPLGVGHVETLKRTGRKWHKRKKEGQRTHVDGQDATRESLRWLRGVEAIERARKGQFEVIHVTDAEGDFLELLESLHARNSRFVIRAGQLKRNVLNDSTLQNLREVVAALKPIAWRNVELSERKHPKRACISSRTRHPNRNAHTARLAIGVTRVQLRQNRYSDVKTEPFEVTVVRVWEPKPPRGQPAVEWVLFTTEKTSTPTELERIVDIYRNRWKIEEYFKALKSGCSLEKRQVESYGALCKVLALFVPIAYRLLLLRGLAKRYPRSAARRAFSQIELELITKSPSNLGRPRPRNVEEAMNCLARLGGHIRNNGSPGWQTLAWGYEKLLAMKLGWEIAMREKHRERYDQS